MGSETVICVLYAAEEGGIKKGRGGKNRFYCSGPALRQSKETPPNAAVATIIASHRESCSSVVIFQDELKSSASSQRICKFAFPTVGCNKKNGGEKSLKWFEKKKKSSGCVGKTFFCG